MPREACSDDKLRQVLDDRGMPSMNPFISPKEAAYRSHRRGGLTGFVPRRVLGTEQRLVELKRETDRAKSASMIVPFSL